MKRFVLNDEIMGELYIKLKTLLYKESKKEKSGKDAILLAMDIH